MRVDIGENYDNSTVMRSLKYSTEFDTVWDDQTKRTLELFLVVTFTNIIYIIFTYSYGHSEIATGVITWSNTMNIILLSDLLSDTLQAGHLFRWWLNLLNRLENILHNIIYLGRKRSKVHSNRQYVTLSM
jgi:hypothetical protein